MPTKEEGLSAKRVRVKWCGEPLKNELFVISLRKILDVKELVIDTETIDETPPTYSPLYRSLSDLYMYHEKYYKQEIITIAACVTNDSSEDRDEELTMTCSRVVKMKLGEAQPSSCMPT